MFAKLTLCAGQEANWLKSQRVSRVIKGAAAALVTLYVINGTVAAAGYATMLRMGPGSSVQNIGETLWVGIAWPIVLQNMMMTEPLQRVEPLPIAAP